MIKSILLSILTFYSVALIAQMKPMYVGTYTNNGSKGIYVYDFNQATGVARLKNTISMSNPSFIARDENFLYAVNEDVEGTITAVDLGNGAILNSLPTNGAHPCHVSLSPTIPVAVVSNYSSGSLVLYSINKDGSLNKQEDFIAFKNSGLNKSRQASSHIHSAFFSKDGQFLFVSDLGGDIIYKMNITKNNDGYKLNIVDEINVKAGGGPRHVVFNDKGTLLYAVLELTGEIEVLAFNKGKWNSKQIVPMYTAGFNGEHGGGDIKMTADAKFIYATNRGQANEIAVYAVKKDGLLKPLQIISVEGNSPRNVQLSPDEKWVIVSNQLTNGLTYFKRDTKTGQLTSVNRRESIPSSVCTIF
ncbi:lactonase family protein [Sphingobacterium rhinopitheci]|uniref:lactonase family protein n=1 Tax=Sphingobacterium rhinopitheci TaxID=2781960 RepID=UPI001F51F0B9|nr:lactonase family protein [Sphingobacterium rhinopitheci]MCI0922499.1 lactonase family protein [Sphingobacterium rhinopitheci]